ncbi:GNAT family N-acetyltransferase [Providencia sp.]|uniref:GNAT family N-acetyltransferase n=1 Tax=Providencia sp. TaxID=589 RepID=UPI003F9B06D1
MLNEKSDFDVSDLIIEPLSENSVLASSALFFQSFANKFNKLKFSSKAEQQSLFNELWKLHFIEQSEQQFVASYKGEIVAAFGICMATDKPVANLNFASSALKLSRQFGLLKTIKATWICSLFNHSPDDHEAYISYIGVSNQFQGKGIGKYILRWIMKYISKNNNIDYISLYVAQNNTGAKKLYENLGFTVDKYEKSLITQLSMNVNSWFYMKYVF